MAVTAKRYSNTETWMYEARLRGWKTPYKAADFSGLSAIVLRGSPVSHRMSMNGDLRYTLALLESAHCEIFDEERDVLIMVRNIPTPERAAELLDKYGVLTKEAISQDAPELLMVPEDEEY